MEAVADELRSPRSKRRLLKGTLVTLGALVIIALVLEVAVRLFLPHPFGPENELAGMYVNDGENSFRLTPDFRGQATIEGRSVAISLNSLGMRSPEVGPRRPGELRVLCLGDSFVFGYGVADDETFPNVLREELAGRLDRQVVTGNAGVPGHGTVDMVRSLEHFGDTFHPDLLVVTIYLGNDFEDDFVLTKLVLRGHHVVGPVVTVQWARTLQTTFRGRLAMRSRLALEIEEALMLYLPSLALQPIPTPEEQAAFAGFPPPEQRLAGLFMDAVDEGLFRAETGEAGISRALARAEESLRRIQELGMGIPVVVAILPTANHLDEDIWKQTLTGFQLDPSDFRMGLAQERLLSICDKLGLAVVDMTDVFRTLPDPQSAFLKVNKHLNPDGHRLVAERLAETIEELLRR